MYDFSERDAERRRINIGRIIKTVFYSCLIFTGIFLFFAFPYVSITIVGIVFFCFIVWVCWKIPNISEW